VVYVQRCMFRGAEVAGVFINMIEQQHRGTYVGLFETGWHCGYVVANGRIVQIPVATDGFSEYGWIPVAVVSTYIV
jgi:hypothetical protein